MKKVKKIFAILMTLAMIMGLGMTAFAETTPQDGVTGSSGKITVKNLTKEETTVKIYKIVEWDETTGGWSLVKEAYSGYVDFEENPVTINWSGLKTYVETESNNVEADYTDTTSNGTISFDNLGIGAYLVVAGGGTTAYNVMGSFTYGYDDNHLMVATDVEIDAKGSSYPVYKTFADDSMQFVALGDMVTYNITTVFPSFPESETSRTFWIEDQPTGLTIQDIKVYVGDMDSPLTLGEDYTLSQTLPSASNVRINFTSNYIGSENVHAANDVKVVVTAMVTDIDASGDFTNKAISDNNSTPAEEKGETGSLTIRKTDGTNLLDGAVFTIAKEGGNPLLFVKENDGEYKLAISGVDNTTTTELEATDGTLVVKGLDEGTYSIVETKAPEGYQIVDVDSEINPVDRTISADDNKKDLNIDVVNTKLHSLPSTGGIGTTIFTIGGIVIMIAAAALFFANRRKNNAQ